MGPLLELSGVIWPEVVPASTLVVATRYIVQLAQFVSQVPDSKNWTEDALSPGRIWPHMHPRQLLAWRKWVEKLRNQPYMWILVIPQGGPT